MIIQSIHEQFPASDTSDPAEDQMKAKMESIQRVYDSLGKKKEAEELTAAPPLEDAKQDATQAHAQSVESGLVTLKPLEVIDVKAAFMAGPLEERLPSEDTSSKQSVKARAVKQGFKEDKSSADEKGFNYYSHVAELSSVPNFILRRSSESTPSKQADFHEDHDDYDSDPPDHDDYDSDPPTLACSQSGPRAARDCKSV